MKLIVGSCFNNIDVPPEHIYSMMNLTILMNMLKIEYEYLFEEGESCNAKNRLIYRFLDSPATHLLIVSPNLGWDSRGLVRFFKIVKEGAEVTAGVFPFFGKYETELILKDGIPTGYNTPEYRVLEANYVRPGFMCFRKDVFIKTKDAFQTYTEPPEFGNPEKTITAYYERSHVDGTEDQNLQKKLREKGIKIWVEPNIGFMHMGTGKWGGNFNAYLLGAK